MSGRGTCCRLMPKSAARSPKKELPRRCAGACAFDGVAAGEASGAAGDLRLMAARCSSSASRCSAAWHLGFKIMHCSRQMVPGVQTSNCGMTESLT